MDYFFNDQLRWNLGWDTPNQGGAFLVTLVPWLWVFTTWLLRSPKLKQKGIALRGGRWLVAAIIIAGEVALTWACIGTGFLDTSQGLNQAAKWVEGR